MSLLIAGLVALICGLVAYLVAMVVPFLSRHAEVIGLVVFLIVLLMEIS